MFASSVRIACLFCTILRRLARELLSWTSSPDETTSFASDPKTASNSSWLLDSTAAINAFTASSASHMFVWSAAKHTAAPIERNMRKPESFFCFHVRVTSPSSAAPASTAAALNDCCFAPMLSRPAIACRTICAGIVCASKCATRFGLLLLWTVCRLRCWTSSPDCCWLAWWSRCSQSQAGSRCCRSRDE